MSGFEVNAILRGMQLTVVGTLRVIKNPDLFSYQHFQQATLAIAVGVIIQLIIQIPIISVKFLLWVVSWVADLDHATWDDKILSGLDFLNKSVLQIPFLLMILMRYITPTLDHVFMDSLHWVDLTYVKKHVHENKEDPKTLRAGYYANLVGYPTKGAKGTSRVSKPIPQAIMLFMRRYARKVGMLLGIYMLSQVRIIGRLVTPAASFYTFQSAVGQGPALFIFGAGIILPSRFIIMFLQTYFASRTLMRELLEPYFCRVRFTPEQKNRWFLDRQGVLFGFAFAFTIVLKTPFLGVLMYGIAQASTAYLITKITSPVPPFAESGGFAETEVTWKNKHEFLRLSLNNLDKLNMPSHNDDKEQETEKPNFSGRKFS